MDLPPSQKRLPFGLRQAKTGSYKSDCKVKVGACYLNSGASRFIVSWNKNKTCPAAKHSGYNYWDQSHAEFNIWSHADTLMNESKGIVFVYRETKRGNLALAKPCISCMNYLKLHNIRTIVYTINNGWEKMQILPYERIIETVQF